jgi:hypothetical protein
MTHLVWAQAKHWNVFHASFLMMWEHHVQIQLTAIVTSKNSQKPTISPSSSFSSGLQAITVSLLDYSSCLQTGLFYPAPTPAPIRQSNSLKTGINIYPWLKLPNSFSIALKYLAPWDLILYHFLLSKSFPSLEPGFLPRLGKQTDIHAMEQSPQIPCLSIPSPDSFSS